MVCRGMRERARGQAIVLAALAFVLLVAFLGLALDGANAFGQSRRVRNVADAAALAGTRELIEQKESGTGGPINAAIEEFIEERNGLTGATWQAFYVRRLEPDGNLGPVENTLRPPGTADGVRVEINLQFNTYFMGVFGQRTLGVGGNGTAVFGPLGTAIGQDLAPLALSQTAREALKDEGEILIDLQGNFAEDWEMEPENFGMELPSHVMTDANFKHVSFREVAGAPVTGDDCANPGAETLTAWWCQGSPNKLRINRELPAGDPSWGNLTGAIAWREDNRPTLVLPVYTPSLRRVGASMVEFYQLVDFIAVDVVNFNQARSTLRLRWHENYTTAGALIGEGSGVDSRVWAVNLTR